MILTIDNTIDSGSTVLTVTSNLPLNSDSVSGISLSRFDGTGYTTIPIISISVSGADIYISIDPLDANKLYAIQFNNILSIPIYNELIDYCMLRFLSVESIPTTNANNIYDKLQKLDNLLSLEDVMLNKVDKTLIFQPITYNTNTEKYEYIGNEVSINNSDIIIDLYINQFFSEYKAYYKNLTQRNNLKTDFALTYSDDYINKLHLYMMKNTVKFNALKGTKFLIELYLSLYAKYLGEFLISVVEDTSQNFVYYISSSISEQFWNSNIKPYIHPLSWSCIYNETSELSASLVQIYSLKQQIIENWLSNWDSQNKFINYRITNNRWSNDNAFSFKSFGDEARFNTLSYTIDLDYTFKTGSNLITFKNEFDNLTINPNLFIRTETSSGSDYIVDVTYTKVGIAYKYEWYVSFNYGATTWVFTTYHNSITFPVPISDWNGLEISLNIVYKNGEYFLDSKAKTAI